MNVLASKTFSFACAIGLMLPLATTSAQEQPSKDLSWKTVTAETMSAGGAWDQQLDASGKLWVAYYDAKRLLRLRAPSGDETLLVPEGRGQAPSGLAMTDTPEGVALLWRDKLPRKGLFFLTAGEKAGAAIDVGGDTDPLARFVAETDGNGVTHLLWYGEKLGQPTGEMHNLYYGSLRAGSEQGPSAPELVMPGIYPVMAADPAGGVMVFTWQAQDGVQRIVSRYRPAGAKAEAAEPAFGDPVVLADVPAITPIFDAFKSGKRWIALWLGQYGADRREFRLEGAYSDNDGAQWTAFVVPGVEGLDVATVQTAVDEAGHIVLAMTARDRSASNDTKQDVYVAQSSDAGSSWEKAVRLRTLLPQDAGSADAAAKLGLDRFHARNPSVAFGSTPGETVVVWEDWRSIRSGLYAALSEDFGKTWTLSNVSLPRPSGSNLGVRYEPSAIVAAGDRYKVLAERYVNDRLEDKHLVELELDAALLKRLAQEQSAASGGVDAKAQQETVRERAQTYWTAMKDGDYAKTYEFLDPFFKARTPALSYLGTMGKIKYTEAQVKDVQVNGSIADVTTYIRASIPEFRVPSTGELVSRPEREATVTNRWLLIDGEWVKEFRIEAQDVVFTRY